MTSGVSEVPLAHMGIRHAVGLGLDRGVRQLDLLTRLVDVAECLPHSRVGAMDLLRANPRLMGARKSLHCSSRMVHGLLGFSLGKEPQANLDLYPNPTRGEPAGVSDPRGLPSTLERTG